MRRGCPHQEEPSAAPIIKAVVRLSLVDLAIERAMERARVAIVETGATGRQELPAYAPEEC
jgi:hypothetical protein